MRTGLPPIEFFQKMKKKPALQAILDDFDRYTMDDLAEIEGQPLWIRKVLVQLKGREVYGDQNENSVMNAEAIADMMMKNSPQQEVPSYGVYEYFGGDWFMSSGRTGAMKVEVKYGDCLYVIEHDDNIEKYIVGMGSSVGVLTKEEWNCLLHNSTPIGMMTKPEYSKFVSDRLGKTFVDREETAKKAGPNSYVEPTESSFTIVRHGITYK